MVEVDREFRGSPLVDLRCGFRAPAHFAEVLTHEIAPPVLGEGRSYRLAHRFQLPDGSLATKGVQRRIWGCEIDGTLRGVERPAQIAAALRWSGVCVSPRWRVDGLA
ncbi:hypothetical protein [Roseicella aquatilis]|uniref:Uncharacterized protein n=1 Tax=Roseicella aquatilis TaxID=2527868 RepID=A0A4R4DCR4_9PROT|nr:hypothetical protein [Roseicella aquatilis]TCZ58526.1 hypothetical protein EXY23_16390 [Roseicella aquatilis]